MGLLIMDKSGKSGQTLGISEELNLNHHLQWVSYGIIEEYSDHQTCQWEIRHVIQCFSKQSKAPF